MVTEADWQEWTYDELVPYLDTITEAFGPERLMIGSDWPVCLLASSYDKVLNVVERFFQNFSDHEKQRIFSENAIRLYQL